ncbi:MAG TPA: hypothetical protein VLC28_13930, partial [Flavitalea sp.]|nr:hypothetical protein [Flavitalea sp.]
MMKMKRSMPLVLVVGIFSFLSCKKENSIEEGDGTLPPPGDSVALSDRQKDTTLDYARDIYLWYNQIPSTFNPRQYGDPNEVMTAIRQYSVEPGFTTPVDRWSFAIKRNEWDDLSSGSAKDFGLNVFFLKDGDLRVKAVEPNSPAGAAGVHRGWQITKVNTSSNITIANVDMLVQAIYNSSSSSFTFKKPDGSKVDLVL